MNVSARVEYGLRAMLVLASAGQVNLTAQALADQQRLPLTFLHAILGELRRARLVRSQRGTDGGYRLALPADQISVGDVIRAMDGSWFRGRRRDSYPGVAEHLGQVWAAIDAAVWRVVDGLTLADLAAGRLPSHVRELLGGPAWTR
ncbi:MAG: RrF2 family transcriptional regulator [Micromonosporaceae bacterium]